MGYILTAILIYIAYRFIVGFVIPVARTTSQVKRQFSAMKEQMEQAQQQYQQQYQEQYNRQSSEQSRPGARGKYDIEGEYIPFEEVK